MNFHIFTFISERLTQLSSIFLLACAASVSSERKAIFQFLAAREIGRAQKREEGGRGGEEERGRLSREPCSKDPLRSVS